MGYRVSWLAVRGLPSGEVLSRLGLRGTGIREDMLESPIAGVPLASGWYLVACNRSYHRFVRVPVVERLSAGCEVITCDVDDTTGNTVATGWRDGQGLWLLAVDATQEHLELEERGDPPALVAQIHSRLARLQEAEPEVDYLSEVPVEVAAAICGFRHDEDVRGAEGEVFQALIEPETLLPGFAGLQLTVEDEPVFQAPSLALLQRAVEWLTPRGGPSFLVLEGPGEDYTQVAGGDGVYTAEWREYHGSTFIHWVAGHSETPSEAVVAIPTNGARVTVREHEQLRAEEVSAILLAFAQSAGKPAEFAWRNITERFQ